MAIFILKKTTQKIATLSLVILAISFALISAAASFNKTVNASPAVETSTAFSGQAAVPNGPANITILLQTPDQIISPEAPVPESYTLTPVGTSTTDVSGNFSISVTDTPAVLSVADNNAGYANFIIESYSGTEFSQMAAKALIDPTMPHPTDVAANSVKVTGLAQAPQEVLSAAGAVSPASSTTQCSACQMCLTDDFGAKATNFEDMRVANEAGVVEEVSQSNRAQDTISVGFSLSPISNFSVNGSVFIGNSIATNSNAYASPNSNEYARTHVYFAEYVEPVCVPVFTDTTGATTEQSSASVAYWLEPTSATGDTWLSTAQKPPAMPAAWAGTCTKDPYGYATVNKADSLGDPGSFGIDNSQSKTVSVGFNLFGFTAGIQAGYDKDVNLTYYDHNKTLNTLVCGNSDPRESGTFYNTLP